MTNNDMLNIGITATNGLQQSIQQLQTSMLSSECCTSKPITIQMGNNYRYLSDIIKTFGDLAIQTLSTDQQYGCVLTMTIEADMYSKKSEKTISDALESMTTNQRKALDYILCEAVKEKENDKMGYNNNNNSMFDAFNGMFGRVENGICRLSMNGNIAVRTSNGYKSYNVKEGRLVNCANFVFPMGDEMFFIIPTNKVEPGDIILTAGLPKCVLKKDTNTITVINYEDSTVETILPERHIFMGETYFYGKIVSMFGEGITGGGKKSMNKIMKFMMMSEMMKSMGNYSQSNNMVNMMPFMMMSGGNMGDIFGGIFDTGEGDSEDETVNEKEEAAT